MKKTLFIFAILFSTALFAQEEWGNLQKNELTLREIAPIWPGCDSKDVSQRDACFDTKLTQHIQKNFKYPAAAWKNKEQGRVVVEFVINEKGMPVVKSATGATKSLQEEAKRNIMAIPKMIKPGMMGGKPRAIKYTVPFTFKM